MNQTALIWALSLALVGLTVVLIFDFALQHKAQIRGTARRAPGEAVDDGACMGASGKLRATDACTGTVENELGAYRRNTAVDLMGQERPVLAVTLPPDNMVIHLLTPTKAMSDRFAEMGNLLERLESGTLAFEGIEQLYKFASMLLSENRERRLFTVSELKSRCSSADVCGLMQLYLAWLTEVISSKN